MAKMEEKRITVELTEAEVCIIGIAVDTLYDLINDGHVEFDMNRKSMLEFGEVLEDLVESFCEDEEDEDEEEPDIYLTITGE